MIENVDGEPGALAAFSAVAQPDATVDGAIVRLHTDVPKLVGTEGLARVVLSSEDGKFTRNISIAWIAGVNRRVCVCDGRDHPWRFEIEQRTPMATGGRRHRRT